MAVTHFGSPSHNLLNPLYGLRVPTSHRVSAILLAGGLLTGCTTFNAQSELNLSDLTSPLPASPNKPARAQSANSLFEIQLDCPNPIYFCYETIDCFNPTISSTTAVGFEELGIASVVNCQPAYNFYSTLKSNEGEIQAGRTPLSPVAHALESYLLKNRPDLLIKCGIKDLAHLTPREAMFLTVEVCRENLSYSMRQIEPGETGKLTSIINDSKTLVELLSQPQPPDGNGVCRNYASDAQGLFETLKLLQDPTDNGLRSSYILYIGSKDSIGIPGTVEGHAWNAMISADRSARGDVVVHGTIIDITFYDELISSGQETINTAPLEYPNRALTLVKVFEDAGVLSSSNVLAQVAKILTQAKNTQLDEPQFLGLKLLLEEHIVSLAAQNQSNLRSNSHAVAQQMLRVIDSRLTNMEVLANFPPEQLDENALNGLTKLAAVTPCITPLGLLTPELQKRFEAVLSTTLKEISPNKSDRFTPLLLRCAADTDLPEIAVQTRNISKPPTSDDTTTDSVELNEKISAACRSIGGVYDEAVDGYNDISTLTKFEEAAARLKKLQLSNVFIRFVSSARDERFGPRLITICRTDTVDRIEKKLLFNLQISRTLVDIQNRASCSMSVSEGGLLPFGPGMSCIFDKCRKILLRPSPTNYVAISKRNYL